MNVFRKLSTMFGKQREQHINDKDREIVSTRDNEPLLVNQVHDQLLLRFFLNDGDQCIPHRHEDIVVFTDDEVEAYHDFIQWIFPTSQPSRFNGDAPTLDAHFISWRQTILPVALS